MFKSGFGSEGSSSSSSNGSPQPPPRRAGHNSEVSGHAPPHLSGNRLAPASSGWRGKFTHCTFCKSNGEDQKFFTTHNLKDEHGRVVCPVLFRYVCPTCGAKEFNAHTIRYCPKTRRNDIEALKVETPIVNQRPTTGMRPILGAHKPVAMPPAQSVSRFSQANPDWSSSIVNHPNQQIWRMS